MAGKLAVPNRLAESRTNSDSGSGAVAMKSRLEPIRVLEVAFRYHLVSTTFSKSGISIPVVNTAGTTPLVAAD